MDTEKKILEICADIMGVSTDIISLETSREECGEFDSLMIIQVVAEMEEVFHCTIDQELFEQTKIETIKDFLKLI